MSCADLMGKVLVKGSPPPARGIMGERYTPIGNKFMIRSTTPTDRDIPPSVGVLDLMIWGLKLT